MGLGTHSGSTTRRLMVTTCPLARVAAAIHRATNRSELSTNWSHPLPHSEGGFERGSAVGGKMLFRRM